MDPGKAAARRTAWWLGGGVALMVVGTFVMFLLARSCTIAPPPPPLLISKETTYLTGPLLPDGGIDWIAALEAEARAEGFKDEENGATLIVEAAKEFVDDWTFFEKQEPFASAPESGYSYGAYEDARAALARGELDAPHVDLLLRWLDANVAVLEKARAAAERPAWFLTVEARPLVVIPTRERARSHYYGMIDALRLRLTVRAARGDVEGALADAAIALALARRTGSPAAFLEQSNAVQWEVSILGQLLRLVRAGSKLPADRALVIAEARPARWNGEAALREALRAERLVATSQLDHARFAGESEVIPVNNPEIALVRAFRRADSNPPYRRLQRLFDDLEPMLLGSGRPPRDRIAELRAELIHRANASARSRKQFLPSLRYSLLSDDELALRFVDRVVQSQWVFLSRGVAGWLSHTARRDALLAELAFLAGAPPRRDSWLGEQLVVTRKEDGTIEVAGALIDLAKERGIDLGEKE